MLGEAEGDLAHGQLGDGSARNAARTIKHEVERQRSPGRVDKSYAALWQHTRDR